MTLMEIANEMHDYINVDRKLVNIVEMRVDRLNRWRLELMEINDKLNEIKELASKHLDDPVTRTMIKIANFQ